jgi:hypothetical protein
MSGDESRKLKVGDKVRWQKDQADQGTVTETNWAGVLPVLVTRAK